MVLRLLRGFRELLSFLRSWSTGSNAASSVETKSSSGQLTYTGAGRILIVSSEVGALWKRYRQLRPSDLEACGILIARFDMDFTRIWIEAASEPGSQDSRSPHSFSMDDDVHQQLVDKAYEESNGLQSFVGTWHTHPEPSPTPSSQDKSGWRKLIRANPDLSNFCFAIVGQKTAGLFLYSGTDFTRLTELRRFRPT
jgi:integrative and conjugative element protein (TIGR02256 family)